MTDHDGLPELRVVERAFHSIDLGTGQTLPSRFLASTRHRRPYFSRDASGIALLQSEVGSN